ncbi:hypothetical protein SESBI_37982, partial [Sesbania bispinosa]
GIEIALIGRLAKEWSSNSKCRQWFTKYGKVDGGVWVAKMIAGSGWRTIGGLDNTTAGVGSRAASRA